VRLHVDGAAVELPDALADETLLRALRDGAAVFAAKNACEAGECGSCTVAIDGALALACLVPAGQAEGREVTTAAGLDDHPVQQALIDHGGVQCGFCTPGIVMAAADLLARNPHPTRADVQEALTGNLCRCTGYEKILDAVVACGS
jgi:aerobic carbon-monoxide dehydrogenase small subunit